MANKKLAAREKMLRTMGEFILENGLGAASLRPLAKAADTSDRMLIYHFGSKQKLLAELLEYLAHELQAQLNAALPLRPARSANKLLTEIVGLLRQEPFCRYMRLWLEIVAAASRGSEVHREVGGRIIDGFQQWLNERLPTKLDNPADTQAIIFLATEGSLVLDAIGRAELSDKGLKKILR